MYLTDEELLLLLAFIKKHERNEVPEDVWELYEKIYDKLDED